MSNYAKFDVFPMVLPEQGPRAVPTTAEFVGNEIFELDLTQLTGNGWLDYVSGVYVDNYDNDGVVTMRAHGSNQVLKCPANCGGYFPLLLPNPPVIDLMSTEAETVKFQWYNVPVFPMLIPAVIGGGGGGGGDVNATIVGSDVVLQVTPEAIGNSEYTLELDGTNQEFIPADEITQWLYIENPTGNGPITVNLNGGDATVTGIQIEGGSYREFNVPCINPINVSGSTGENILAYGI